MADNQMGLLLKPMASRFEKCKWEPIEKRFQWVVKGRVEFGEAIKEMMIKGL